MHGYARRQSVEGLARDTACRAAGKIGESAHPGPRMSAKDPLAKTCDVLPIPPATPRRHQPATTQGDLPCGQGRASGWRWVSKPDLAQVVVDWLRFCCSVR
jgi:hypothetical protein